MQINLYASYRVAAKTKTLTLDLPAGARLGDVIVAVLEQLPVLRAQWLDAKGNLYPHVHIFVNGRDQARLEQGLDIPLAAQDHLDIFPPVAGGSTGSMWIRPFRPADQPACKALILAGLVEHWGFLDPSLNPDLDDIDASYAQGCFLTAWEGEGLIGTGAFLAVDAQTVQVVRMSVLKALRAKGVGSTILAALLAEAATRGYLRAVLETTETWQEVVRFYLKAGFEITHRLDGDIFFEKDLLEQSA
jgi:GNAT superfamily N-acetyltransferase/molybdopterin converting factor small subunit